MLNKLLCAALVAATLWTAPAFARDDSEQLGKGDYFVFHRTSRPLTTLDFDVMKEMDQDCRRQSKGQRPSAFKTIFITALRNAPGAVLFGGLGAKAGGFTGYGAGVVDYGIYSGLNVVGNSIGSGITAHAMGKNATQAGCMMGMMNLAYREGQLRHVFITYNTFPTRGRALRRSSLPQPTQADVEAGGRFVGATAPQNAAPQDPDLLAPPPR